MKEKKIEQDGGKVNDYFKYKIKNKKNQFKIRRIIANQE
jgi:hypothetical protein